MIQLDNSLPIRIIGDMHHAYERVLPELLDPQSYNLIYLGDLGPDIEWYLRLVKIGHKVLCIRGNHDPFHLFQEGEVNTFFKTQGIQFLTEVSILQYREKKILAVGGAISIDRSICHERRKTDVSPLAPMLIPKETQADLMLSHAPPLNGVFRDLGKGFVSDFAQDDHTLLEDLEREQRMLQKCMDAVGADRSIFGHLHSRYQLKDDKLRTYQCLDIGEILDLKV